MYTREMEKWDRRREREREREREGGGGDFGGWRGEGEPNESMNPEREEESDTIEQCFYCINF